MSKYHISGTVTFWKYVPKVTEALIEISGDTREELEDAIGEFEYMDKEELAEQVVGSDWWDDKHGWWASESEQLILGNLTDEDMEFDWEDLDEHVRAVDKAEEEE